MRVLLLFVFTSLLRPTLAQVAAKEAVGTPICYSSNIPKSVSRLMPRGAKSLFWGTFTPKKGSGLMGIHLFNRRVAQSNGYAVHVSGVSGLDVFRQSEGGWLKTNGIPISYSPFFEDEETDKVVDAKLVWVDAQRKIPMLRLGVFSPKGGYGPIGDEIGLTFSRGFGGSAHCYIWRWGSWFASNSIGNLLHWERDEKGFLKLTEEERTTHPDRPSKWALWRWQHDRFVLWRREVTVVGPEGTFRVEDTEKP